MMDFESVEAHEASPDTILPAGNYVGKVTLADDGSSSGGYAQIALKLEAATGTSWDWLVISDAEFSHRKVKGLFFAAGVEVKNEWFDEAGHCKQAVLNKMLLGKTVGWIVRDEEDWKDATKTRPRVQGYCRPDRIPNPGPLVQNFGADVPIDTAGLEQASFAGVGRSSQRSDEDLPF